MTPTIALLVLAAFSGASFFFALAETSLFSLGKWQLRQLETRFPHRAVLIGRLLSEPQDLLATLVLGNSIANAGIVMVALWLAVRHQWPLALVFAALLVLILFGAEVAPKTLAVRAPELWALRVARLMTVLQGASRPLRRVAQWVTNQSLRGVAPIPTKAPSGLSDAEYQELLEMAYQQGALAAGEKEIILQIINLDRRHAGDVMKVRLKVACISDDLSVPEMIEAARRFKHRRLPIYDDSVDTIVGVLNTRVLLLDPEADLAAAIEFPSFVPESMNLLQLLKSLQRQQRGLAIVLDEFGGTAGIVTIEDILAEVLGEIRSEHAPERAIVEKVAENRWRVSGSVLLDNFRREYPPLPDVPGFETMAGMALHEFEVVPAPGESVTAGGLRLTVQAADERRIRELLVEVVKKR
ncbi:MAG TPA: hemolysin family protein [Candidatus Baltobacteraceae bacterium]|jgi:CBS domain containing-hemolysin-like protein|nr:hemolysin family protein [Candidatus Baltobacteraceae bacterium]